MNPRDTLALLRGMVAIPSLSGQEHHLAAYLVVEMERLGYRSVIDPAGNAIGEIGSGGGPLILLLGHMDTVAPVLPTREVDGTLYGRGVVDAKGALATFICAAASCGSRPARLVVAGAVEEETAGARGARYLLDRYQPDAVIVGEPSGWANVVLGYKGRVGITHDIVRPQSHSASPVEKSTEVGVAFWNKLVGHFAALSGERTLFHRPTATLCRFEGSGERARLEITCRTPPDFDYAAFERFLRESSGTDTLHIEEQTPAVLVDRGVPPVRALVQSIRRHGGRPSLKIKSGTSDMNVVAERWRVPMVAYGPGDSSLDHTMDEHLHLDEYLRSIEVLGQALRILTDELAPAVAAAAGGVAETYTADEEEAVTRRLQALGYLD